MKIIFENLGPIERGEIELNKLNIFCGRNNEGKTYINYLIYTILTTIDDLNMNVNKNFIEELSKEKKELEINLEKIFLESNRLGKILLSIEQEITRRLPEVFSVSSDFFKDFKIKIDLNSIVSYLKNSKSSSFFTTPNYSGIIERENEILKIKLNYDLEVEVGEIFEIKFSFPQKQESELDNFNKLILSYMKEAIFNFKKVYSFPAERSGLAIFYNELLIGRNNILDSFVRDNEYEDNLKNMIARYPKTINDYINFLSSISNIIDKKTVNEKFKELAEDIEKDFLGGEYKVKDNKKIVYIMKNGKELELYTSSSLVKTVVGIILYLKYYASYGDYFLIDEPELNLHPENQRRLARVFVKMVNYGINIVMTTHSPYIINELNNLIMLNKVSMADKKRIMINNGIVEDNIVKLKDISAYLVNNHKIEEMNKGEFGLEVESFNETVDDLNNLSDDIYSSIED